jgi:hypothetical protein
MPIDYRALLVKYMEHIASEEGVTYVSSMALLDPRLTDAEKAALLEINEEVKVTMKQWLA